MTTDTTFPFDLHPFVAAFRVKPRKILIMLIAFFLLPVITPDMQTPKY